LEAAKQEHEIREEERLAAIPETDPADDPKRKQRDFDDKLFLRKWDAENAKIEVPPPVEDDLDNDYDITHEE
jgi:hypothetical protein